MWASVSICLFFISNFAKRVYFVFRTGFIFGMLADTDEVGSLAPIEVVMLPEAQVLEAKPQHLNGKRGARF